MSEPFSSLVFPSARLRRWLLASAALACVVWPLATAAHADEGEDSAALDATLLEDLGAGLFDEGAAAADDGAAADLDEQLTRELVQPDGDDVGAGQGAASPNDWLKHIRERMQQAESVLAARDASGRASTTQQEVVSELDAMIAKLQKQCEKCGGQCNKPPGPQNKPPKPGGKSGAKPGETSAAAATAATAPADRTAIGNLVKDLWGRLPERQREELLQPLSEEFLPEYAADIEEYFRVLAETPADAAAETQP